MFTLRLVAVLALVLLAILLCGCSPKDGAPPAAAPIVPVGRPDETPIVVSDGGSLTLKSLNYRFSCWGDLGQEDLLYRPEGDTVEVTITENGTDEHKTTCSGNNCRVEIEYERGLLFPKKAGLAITGNVNNGKGILIKTLPPHKSAEWDSTDAFTKTFDGGHKGTIRKVTIKVKDTQDRVLCEKKDSCQVVIFFKHPTDVPANCK